MNMTFVTYCYCDQYYMQLVGSCVIMIILTISYDRFLSLTTVYISIILSDHKAHCYHKYIYI